MTPEEIQKIALQEIRGRYKVLLKSYLYCISSTPADEGHESAYDHDCFTLSFVAEKEAFFAFVEGCESRGVAVKYSWYATDEIDVAIYDCICRERTVPRRKSWFR